MTVSIPSNTLEKFTTFGDLLRFLRRRMGITQTELAIVVGYSHTQISRLEQNLRLPDIPTIEARFVSALGLEQEPKAVVRLLDLAANVRREDAPALGLCPYKGLNYFDEADADLFVGREALTAKLVERVFSLTLRGSLHKMRFLAVVGASGSGKSSLVRAGLVSALRWHKASTDWQIHVLTPTAHPLENLAATLTQEINSATAIATLMDDLARDSRSLQIFAKRKVGSENNVRLLLVVDQFEELFALCRSDEERTSFIGNLLMAASETDGPGRVNRVAFSPDGKMVATSGDDRTARIWDPLSGKEIMVFKGHSYSVTGVAFSPDGKYLVTASADGSVRLWEVATGQEVRRFTGHINRVRDVAFSPDGKYVLTASNDLTARLWLTDYHDTILAVCAPLTRDLTPDERIQFGIPDQAPTCPAQ
ncbi:MAG TPA: helix-turn-helix domain-containing protein [Anaerolineales bacterium]